MSLLPTNSTVFERAIETSLHRVSEIDVAALRRMRDPWLCSVSHLPFLAWGRGVDLWYEDWPEYRKRRITADAYRLKGLKGTLPGIDAYLGYVDARVEDFVIPPQATVARAQAPARIAAFKARFAQLRVYPHASRGRRPGTVAAVTGSVMAIVGRGAARPNLARENYGRRAVIVDRGVETVIRSQDQLRVDTDETSLAATSFAIPETARRTETIAGSIVRLRVGRTVAHQAARGRMFVLGADGLNAAGAAIPPGGSSVRVLNIEPEKVFERHDGLSFTPVAASAPKTAVGGMIARATRAGRFIYQRWYLFDAARAGFDPYQTLGPVVGKMVSGLSPFRAHLRVDARFAGTGRRAVVGRVSVNRAVAGNPSDRILRVGRAIYRAKALRDDIRFTTRTYRPRAIGDLSFDASHRFGGMVPINRRTA